ncbi:MAG: hypothetical protein HDR84_07350 [Bacteroides sp.]|nr:hypothetical protein [Bacteroidales bacterium]MBD5349043.1 hypothetical protein [Bacteroides sp.]
MKKSFTLLKKLIVASFLLVIVAACGTKLPTDSEVAQKIDAKESLSEADYTTMIDYCGKYAEEAQKYYDIINAQPNDSTAEYIKAADDLATLYGNYAYLDAFRQTLNNSEVSQLGKENEKKVNEYAKYQAFPLPGGEAANLQNPNVVGDIENMPSPSVSDSTGVISAGDGEAVDMQVK